MKCFSVFLGVLATFVLSTEPIHAAVPATPEYLKVAWIENQDEFLIRWLPVAEATSYNVFRYDTNAAAWVQIATNLVTALRVPMFRDPTVPEPGPVTYAVSAVNAEGEGLAAVASLTPQGGAGLISSGDAYPPAGFTWAILSFSTDREPGSDTMIELTGGYDINGPVHTNVFDVMWNTNISQWHQLQFTNLGPSSRYSYRYTRVEENGYGLSYSESWHWFYTAERFDGSGYEENPIGIFGWVPPVYPVQIYTQPANGVAELYPGYWSFLYTGNTNFHGTDSFQILDHPSGPPVTITVYVTNINDAPVASPFTIYMAEDTTVEIRPEAFDVENDGPPYNFWPDSQYTPNGFIVPWTGGMFTYTPNENFVGTDQFYFYAIDFDWGPATLGTVIVTNVNDAPVAHDKSVTVNEDGSVAVAMTGSDVEGDALTFAVVTQPQHGQYVAGVYTPAANYFGPDSFTYKANDGQLDSSPATVSIAVAPVNDLPIADNKSAVIDEDQSVGITFSGSDIEGSALTFAVVDEPQHGQFVDGTYTPAPNYFGPDSFTYKANDGQADSALATVTITVNPINDAPTAQPQSLSTAEDSSLSITLAGADVEGSPLSFGVLSGPAHGTLSGVAPNLLYTPVANYNGSDSFTFKTTDGSLDSSTATVSITVAPVNDAPTADSKTASVNEDGSVAITLTGSDVDGDALTFAVIDAPQHGEFSGGVYTPAANYFGSDSFSYRANDGQANSAVATVSITVNPVNDAPVANNQSVSTAYNTAVNIVLTGSDVEGSALTYTTLTSPANGTLTGTGANRTFTPNIGWYGTTSFTFTVNDGALDSGTATVTITVAGPGSVPAAPSGLTATAVSQTQINLGWNDNSGNEDGFKIERSPNGNSSWTQIATVGPNVSTYSNTGLTKNTRYHYRVRAYNALGNSAYSNTANARTLN